MSFPNLSEFTSNPPQIKRKQKAYQNIEELEHITL